ncbi:hypothetical protein ILYODFUR_006941 [Ilyodon furcidens]|uniref:Uncharacterized protein n=1 Tax=Ilyodon furcidens TaxID=33524 RepID=A0ABV0V0Y3_9TELE
MGWMCDVPEGVGLWAEIKRRPRREGSAELCDRAQRRDHHRALTSEPRPDQNRSHHIRSDQIRSHQNRLMQPEHAAVPTDLLTLQSPFRRLRGGLSHSERPAGENRLNLTCIDCLLDLQ